MIPNCFFKINFVKLTQGKEQLITDGLLVQLTSKKQYYWSDKYIKKCSKSLQQHNSVQRSSSETPHTAVTKGEIRKTR